MKNAFYSNFKTYKSKKKSLLLQPKSRFSLISFIDAVSTFFGKKTFYFKLSTWMFPRLD